MTRTVFFFFSSFRSLARIHYGSNGIWISHCIRSASIWCRLQNIRCLNAGWYEYKTRIHCFNIILCRKLYNITLSYKATYKPIRYHFALLPHFKPLNLLINYADSDRVFGLIHVAFNFSTSFSLFLLSFSPCQLQTHTLYFKTLCL